MTTMQRQDYMYFLHREFAKRNLQNRSYSLRAYARDIGIHPGSLVSILKGIRALPLKNVEPVIDRLELSPIESENFRNSRKTQGALKELGLSAPGESVVLNEVKHEIIGLWEHYGILNLIKVKGFKSDIDWIADRLGISQVRVQHAIDNLVQANLLFVDENKNFKRTHGNLETTQDVLSTAILKSHDNSMEMAKEKLRDTPISAHYYGHETFSIKKDKVEEAKKILREFRKKFSATLEENCNGDEVYRLNLQFFPLTNIEEQGE